MHRLAKLAVATGFVLAIAACYSSGSSPPADGGDATTCVPADGSIAAELSSGASPTCSACIQQHCGTQVDACAGDCTCNDTSLTALACIAGLSGNASVAAEGACVAPLTSSSDTTLMTVGSCLLACVGACGGGVSDAGGCGSTDASLLSLVDSGADAGACASCVATTCASVNVACAGDCTCNAEAVTALGCLSDLGATASLASVASCVAPLTSAALAGGDAGPLLVQEGQCLLDRCAAQCGMASDSGGGVAEAGPEAEAGPGDAAPDSTSVDASDAAAHCPSINSPNAYPTLNYPATVVSDGTNVYWTTFSASAGGSIQREGVSGGAPQTVVGSRSSPWGLAVDATYVYWTEDNGGSGHGQVLKAPKDADGGAPVLIASNQVAPRGIVFDGTNLYWTTSASAASGGGVWTALPNAGATVTEIGTPQETPLGIALDANKVVYWQSYGTGANDGIIAKWDPVTTTQTTLATGQSGQYGIALSPDGSTVYWTNYDQANVAYTSTTPATPLATPTILATDASRHPRGIFVDAPNALNPQDLVVYWTDFDNPGNVWFWRNGLKCSMASGQPVAQGIFVDTTYLYFLNFSQIIPSAPLNSGALVRMPKLH